VSVSFSSVRSAQGIKVNAAFFAPLMGISPLSVFPPLIQMLSTRAALAYHPSLSSDGQ